MEVPSKHKPGSSNGEMWTRLVTLLSHSAKSNNSLGINMSDAMTQGNFVYAFLKSCFTRLRGFARFLLPFPRPKKQWGINYYNPVELNKYAMQTLQKALKDDPGADIRDCLPLVYNSAMRVISKTKA